VQHRHQQHRHRLLEVEQRPRGGVVEDLLGVAEVGQQRVALLAHRALPRRCNRERSNPPLSDASG
jgi:hypothetical protein